MKNFRLFYFMILISFCGFSQKDNEQRKGNYYIFYDIGMEYYDYLNRIPNLAKVLIPTNETNDFKNTKYVEKVKYKKGVKNGDFFVFEVNGTIYTNRKINDIIVRNNEKWKITWIWESSDNKSNSKIWNYQCSLLSNPSKTIILKSSEIDTEKNILFEKFPMIASGKYKDGKIIDLITIYKKVKTEDYEKTLPICQVLFADGVIKNQDIILYNEKGLNRDNTSHKIAPIIKIRNGVCFEEIITKHDKYDILKTEKTSSGYIQTGYLRNFLNIPKQSFMNFLLIPTSFLTEKIEYDMTFKNIQKYSLYRGTNVPLDTSRLGYQRNFLNGKAEGASYWKIGNVNLIEMNYSNGLLNGPVIVRSSNQDTLLIANYKDGILHGKFSTYYCNDGVFEDMTTRIPLLGPFCQKTNNLEIYDIIQNCNDYDPYKNSLPIPDHISVNLKLKSKRSVYIQDLIKELQKEGYQITMDGKFKFFEANYENGELKGGFKCYQSNGSKLFEGDVSNCSLVNWTWFDKDGKVIYSLKKNQEYLKEKNEKTIEYFNALDNSKIKCNWCSKEIIYKNGIVLEECKCIGMGIYVDPTRYCSQKCKSDAERDCCRKNGYGY